MQLRLNDPLPQTAPRSAEILRGVKAAFVEKGFDGASMQDLARAAGMSVGNFYRYFPSKDAIVAQMIAQDMAEIEAEFARVLSSPRPMETLRALIAHRIDDEAAHDGPLWAEVAAAALRKPEIAACTCAMEEKVSGYLTTVFAAETGLSPAEAAQRFGSHAGFIILLIRSSAMIAPKNTGADSHLNTLILRTINQVLDEIASAGSKG